MSKHKEGQEQEDDREVKMRESKFSKTLDLMLSRDSLESSPPHIQYEFIWGRNIRTELHKGTVFELLEEIQNKYVLIVANILRLWRMLKL